MKVFSILKEKVKSLGIRPLVCVAVVCFQLLLFSSSAQTFGGGDGTLANPYKISTPEHLIELSENVPTGLTALAVYFAMTNSIDMSGIDFTPIGTGARPFGSNFNGQGYAIKNLSATLTPSNAGSGHYLALFARVGTAIISNLTIDKAAFVGNHYVTVSAFVGDASTSLSMNNCKVINSTLQGGSVYGLFSGTNYASIGNCHVVNTTIEGINESGGAYASGFCSSISSGSVSQSSVSYSTITIDAINPSSVATGFMYQLGSQGSNLLLFECYVANCSISEPRIAAITDRVRSNMINCCYAQASLSRTTPTANQRTADGFMRGMSSYSSDNDTLRVLSSYTACEFSSLYAGTDIAWGYGLWYTGEKLKIDNCFYNLDPVPSGGYVTDDMGVAGKSPVGKTQAYMKSAAMVDFPGTHENSLNYNRPLPNWKQDFTVNPINKGYPVLVWQEHQNNLRTYVIDVAHTTATFEGFAFTDSDPYIEYGFEWREKGAANWTTNQVTLGGTDFSLPITGLRSNTEYECIVYAKTASATLYGDTMPFKTLLREAVATTLPAVNMTDSTAILKGMTVANDETILEQGFEWKEYGTTDWDTNTVLLSLSNITLPLTGLTRHEGYEFRAYVVTENATRYGKILVFTAADPHDTTITTQKIAEVITLPASNITERSATVHGMVTANDETILSQGFEWRVLYSGDSWTISMVALGASFISLPLSGLPNHKPYEFRAYAQTPDDTRYGVILTFTTTEEETSIKDIAEETKGISIYPNPTDGRLRITHNSGINPLVEVYDIVGVNVGAYSIRPTQDEVIIDISHLAAGLYFLKIDNKTFKVVKQ